MKYKRYSIKLKFRDGEIREVKEDNYYQAWDYFMHAENAWANELLGMALIDNNDGSTFETMGESF